MSMFVQLSTIMLPSSICDHTPFVISFDSQHQCRKQAPFRYVNSWCYEQGDDHYIAMGWSANTWCMCSDKFIRKLKAEGRIKKWNRLRAYEKPITHLQSEFDTLFYQLDQDSENTTLYDSMYCMGQSLNEKIQKHNEFLRQQSNVL